MRCLASPAPDQRQPDLWSTATLTSLALLGFAGNSVLTRLALHQTTIDPATFTTLRLISGAAILSLLALLSGRPAWYGSDTWMSAAILVLYAVPFSFAYTRVSAGTGALILFGSVQTTMMIAALREGERPSAAQWIGLILALAGLIYLLLPGVAEPSMLGAALMTTSGCFWGIYSLRGRRAGDPLARTATNFVRAIPFTVVVSAASVSRFRIDRTGAALAVVSGSITSGLGYVIWYAALRRLTAVRATVVQLAVPVLAAIGGVLFLSEVVVPRLIVATVFVLGGILLAISGREKAA